MLEVSPAHACCKKKDKEQIGLRTSLTNVWWYLEFPEIWNWTTSQFEMRGRLRLNSSPFRALPPSALPRLGFSVGMVYLDDWEEFTSAAMQLYESPNAMACCTAHTAAAPCVRAAD